MIEFPRDFKEFLQLLNSKKIDYLVVGGYAVGYHLLNKRASGRSQDLVDFEKLQIE